MVHAGSLRYIDSTQIKESGFQGWPYRDVLLHLHRGLRPRTYLEVGTSIGRTIALASCASIAVDPAFRIEKLNVIQAKPLCLFFQMTSDDFFGKYDVVQLFGGRADLVFLDGLHLFECLLRDFTNTEKCCSERSIV